MALVFRFQPPHRSAILAHSRNHLLRFAGGNAWVILSRNHKKRLGNVLRFVKWCDLLQEVAHFRIALVAIFDPAQILTVSRCVLKERDQVRWPDYIDGTANRSEERRVGKEGSWVSQAWK